MQWGNGGGGFNFGALSGIQQGLYEDKPDLAYQLFTDWFGGGNAGFQNTALGRFLGSQQAPLYNRFVTQQAANPLGGLTWTKFLEQQAPGMLQQFQDLPQFMRGVNPNAYRVRRELW